MECDILNRNIFSHPVLDRLHHISDKLAINRVIFLISCLIFHKRGIAASDEYR